jgi:hypothetical protein
MTRVDETTSTGRQGRGAACPAECVGEIGAGRNDDPDDDGEAERCDDQRAAETDEREVPELAADVGWAGFAIPDDPEGDADRGHHPARAPEQNAERDEPDDWCRGAGCGERVVDAGFQICAREHSEQPLDELLAPGRREHGVENR